MSKTQEGIVLETSGRTARVKTSRHNDCENCGACPGNSAIIVDAYNPVGAKTGQRVVVAVQEVNMLKAAFVVYILPLLAAFLGAAGGGLLAGHFGAGEMPLQLTGGLVAFLLSIGYIKYFDYTARMNEKMRPVVAEVLSK